MNKIVTALSYTSFNEGLTKMGVTDENVEEYTKTAFIQIQGEQDAKSLGFHFDEDHPNVLTMLFDDVDVEMELPLLHSDGRIIEMRYAKPMTMAQAERIVVFVSKNKHVESFLVHCHAGISRSGGVAEWIAEFLGIPWTEFRRRNPHTSSNKRIVKLLREAASRVCGHP